MYFQAYLYKSIYINAITLIVRCINIPYYGESQSVVNIEMSNHKFDIVLIYCIYVLIYQIILITLNNQYKSLI